MTSPYFFNIFYYFKKNILLFLIFLLPSHMSSRRPPSCCSPPHHRMLPSISSSSAYLSVIRAYRRTLPPFLLYESLCCSSLLSHAIPLLLFLYHLDPLSSPHYRMLSSFLLIHRSPSYYRTSPSSSTIHLFATRSPTTYCSFPPPLLLAFSLWHAASSIARLFAATRRPQWKKMVLYWGGGRGVRLPKHPTNFSFLNYI